MKSDHLGEFVREAPTTNNLMRRQPGAHCGDTAAVHRPESPDPWSGDL